MAIKRDRPERRTGEPVGTPSLITDQIRESVVTELLDWGSMVDAAAMVGLNVDTLRHWIREGSRAQRDLENKGIPIPANRVAWVAFSAAVKMAKAMARREAIGGIRAAVRDGNWQAGAWYLERTAPDDYARRTKTELTGADGGPVKVAGTVSEAIAAAIAATPGHVEDDD